MNIRKAAPTLLLALGAATGAAAQEVELGYTYLDFNLLYQQVDAAGSRTDPALMQTVAVATHSGEGVAIDASVALPGHLFLFGELSTSDIEVEAAVFSPIAVETASDNFDLVQGRAGVGYHLAFSERLHGVMAVSFDHATFDFGSFATEDLDVDGDGVGGSLGLRARLGEQIELNGSVRYTSVGDVDLDRARLDSDILFSIRGLYYFSEAFAIGAEYESGAIETMMLNMRFSFGKLGFGTAQ